MNTESHDNPLGRSVRATHLPAVEHNLTPAAISETSGIGQRLRLDMERLFGMGHARALNRAAYDRDAFPLAEQSDNTPPRASVKICSLLNQCIADCLDLQSQCRQTRWHLMDRAYLEPRSICTQAIQLIEHHVDLLSHRVIQLGGLVESTVRQVAERSGLSEYPIVVEDPQGLIEAVSLAFGLESGAMRDDCHELIELGDAISHDLLDQTAVSLEQCRALLESLGPSPIMPSDRLESAD